METTKNNLAMPIAIVVAGAIIAGAIIFTNSDNSSTSANTPATEALAGVPAVIENIGLDIDDFNACMEDPEIAETVNVQHTTATSLGLRGTPHSIVLLENGTSYRINGAYPYDTVAITVEAALAGVNAETIQNFLDLFQTQGTTEADINSYAQEYFIPAIAARQEGTPLPAQEAAGERLNQGDRDLITSIGTLMGSSNAQVQIIEFSDPECPFCARYHTTMNQIMNDYGSDGLVAWRYIHFFPFDSRPDAHPNARSQAEAAECVKVIAGEDKFWEYLDGIFEYNSSK